MGCHSHKQNGHGLDVCRTDKRGAESRDENCITCHMPKVKGSATNIRVSKRHAYHGFAGVINRPELLSRYIDMGYRIGDGGFTTQLCTIELHTTLCYTPLDS